MVPQPLSCEKSLLGLPFSGAPGASEVEVGAQRTREEGSQQEPGTAYQRGGHKALARVPGYPSSLKQQGWKPEKNGKGAFSYQITEAWFTEQLEQKVLIGTQSSH